MLAGLLWTARDPRYTKGSGLECCIVFFHSVNLLNYFWEFQQHLYMSLLCYPGSWSSFRMTWCPLFYLVFQDTEIEGHFISLKLERMLLVILPNILNYCPWGSLLALWIGSTIWLESRTFQAAIWVLLMFAEQYYPASLQNYFHIFLCYYLRILKSISFLTVFQEGNDCLQCAGKCPLYLILTNGDEIAFGSWYS